MSGKSVIDPALSSSHLISGCRFTILAGLGESHLEHGSKVLDTADHVDSGVVSFSEGRVASVVDIVGKEAKSVVDLLLHALVHVGSVAVGIDSSECSEGLSLGQHSSWGLKLDSGGGCSNGGGNNLALHDRSR